MKCVLKYGCTEGCCDRGNECYYATRAYTNEQVKASLHMEPNWLIEGNRATKLPHTERHAQPANPKQHYGDKKLPLYLVPFTFVAHVCTALFEGKEKYGLVNWRAAKIEAMTYISACKRHMDKWTNGERCDPITKVHHLANAAACLCIVIDAEVNGSLLDNRPLPIPQGQLDAMVSELEATLGNLRKLYGDKHPKHYVMADAV